MIKFNNVCKKFDETTVLENVNFGINEGEIFVLLGASGCGKTTCLKMINRLEAPSAGEIFVRGKNIRDEDVIPYRRNIGYVLQNTGLFPHMTVRENLSLLQEIENIPKDEIVKTNHELMKMIGMEEEEYLDRYPYQLSGGQKQRVGVARAFALNPDIILMDEPFSAVDPLVRLSLQDELLEIQRQKHKTIVFVTHDIGEAFRIGSRICLFHDKEVVQCGTPDDLIMNPANEYVQEFIGKAISKHNPQFSKIKDILRKDVLIVNSHERVADVGRKLKEENASKVIVLDENRKVVGTASAQRIARNAISDVEMGQIMWRHFDVVNQNEEINDAVRKMNEFGVSYLPVVNDDEEIKGVITAVDLLKFVTVE